MKKIKTKIKDFPSSDNVRFWQGERYVSKPIKQNICSLHKRGCGLDGGSYVDNNDGTISCMNCPYGFLKPGYVKIHKGKVFDLRRG
jgi:hypothetical protein